MAQSVFYFTDSTDFGGAEQALLLLVEHLDRDAWRPTLLYNESPGIAPLVERARDLGAELRPVPAAPEGLAGARRVPELVRMLRAERPVVFHAHLTWPLAAKYPLAAAVLARVPAVVATVQLYPDFTMSRSTSLQHRLLAAGIDRYIAVSADIAARLVRELHRPAAKLEVIHNGVAAGNVSRPDAALRCALGGGERIVLAAGRLTPQKGFDALVRAVPLVPGARFAVAGDGPERAHLEAAAEALGVGDRIRFLGRRDDVPRLLAAADVFAAPSLWEGTSLAIVEAMLAAKPVVATAIAGTTEQIVDGESGLLVPPDDHEALAAALRSVVGDAASARRLGAAARDRALSRFTIEIASARVAALYRSILAEPDGD